MTSHTHSTRPVAKSVSQLTVLFAVVHVFNAENAFLRQRQQEALSESDGLRIDARQLGYWRAGWILLHVHLFLSLIVLQQSIIAIVVGVEVLTTFGNLRHETGYGRCSASDRIRSAAAVADRRSWRSTATTDTVQTAVARGETVPAWHELLLMRNVAVGRSGNIRMVVRLMHLASLSRQRAHVRGVVQLAATSIVALIVRIDVDVHRVPPLVIHAC